MARDLYDLRSKIAHGRDSIDKDKLKIAGQEVTLREAAEKPRERFEHHYALSAEEGLPGGLAPCHSRQSRQGGGLPLTAR